MGGPNSFKKKHPCTQLNARSEEIVALPETETKVAPQKKRLESTSFFLGWCNYMQLAGAKECRKKNGHKNNPRVAGGSWTRKTSEEEEK